MAYKDSSRPDPNAGVRGPVAGFGRILTMTSYVEHAVVRCSRWTYTPGNCPGCI